MPSTPPPVTPDSGSAAPDQEPATTASRRTVLKGAAGMSMALGTLGFIVDKVVAPARAALPPSSGSLPDIQFDVGAFSAPPVTLNDGAGPIVAGLPPANTVFVTAKLNRAPTAADQAMLASALATIESHYPFSAKGIIMFIAYGLPYFEKLRGGLTGSLCATHIPRLASDHTRMALEEAVPGPTDVSSVNPGITKVKYNVPVVIESNDFLLTIRSDHARKITDVLRWLGGSNRLNGASVASPALFKGLATITSSRVQFVSIGTPRKVADAHNLPFAGEINPDSPMFMGFLDQHVDGAGPAAIVTFAGNASAHVTTAKAGDYFDNGSIQHLSHDIEDLPQFYAKAGDPANPADPTGEPFTERCQYMFRSNPIPALGNTDQFTNGGGPAYVDNTFNGTGDALANASAVGTLNGEHRLGHESCLQRSSRAADGTPMHIRIDGPGYDSLDVPDGSNQPKLQFSIFVPSSEFFRAMRENQASLDLQAAHGVDPSDNGLERFITATRRQNFLIPPRRNRAFPLVELIPTGNTGSGPGSSGASSGS